VKSSPLFKRIFVLTLTILLISIVVSSNSSAAFIKTATDPSMIGVGARPIGMGKAFVGLADDVSSIFYNPAGLAGLRSWQVMSMTTKLLNVIDYVTLAGTYNTEIGTFGLGYVGASLGGSFVTDYTWVEDRGIISPVPSEEAIEYSSTVMLLSYGSEAKRFLNFDFLDKVSVGTTLKVFSQGLSGGSISDGMLTGYDMDIGLLYKPITWLSVGLNQIDALPVSMGGKLSGGGVDHSIPSITKFGFAFKVLGEEGNSIYTSPQPLVYVLDFDYMPTKTSYPITWRTGVEWWLSNYLALRCGLDQDVIGKDEAEGFMTEINLAAGVGIQFSGFKFDYAYHRYGIVSENETSFLSLSYASPIELQAPAPAPEEMKYVQIFSPKDKMITYDEATVITGKIIKPEGVNKLTINGKDVAISEEGTFEAVYPLAAGKNPFNVAVLDKDGKILETNKIRLLKLIAFKDVPAGDWKDSIEFLATLGIIGGYPDKTFRPDKTINRAELTTLLARAKVPTTPEATDTIFTDVTRKHWASFYIKNGVDIGLVTGYPDKTFRPAKSLTRAEGVTILSRFAGLKEPETILEGPFPDVPGRHWAAKSITAARSAGMLMYLIDKPFEPEKEMTRAEAAEVLSKTPYASAKISEVKDFDTY